MRGFERCFYRLPSISRVRLSDTPPPILRVAAPSSWEGRFQYSAIKDKGEHDDY